MNPYDAFVDAWHNYWARTVLVQARAAEEKLRAHPAALGKAVERKFKDRLVNVGGALTGVTHIMCPRKDRYMCWVRSHGEERRCA